MSDLTPTQVGRALANLGNYRVVRAQRFAAEGEPDGISGSLLLALGLRETNLKNIEGGAMFDAAQNKWVAQTDPKLKDVGFIQISRKFHALELSNMPGVANGNWGPPVEGKTANTPGFVPRFGDQLIFIVPSLQEAQAFAHDHDVPQTDLVRFAVAAHNAGLMGALNGHKAGDVDKYTANGDYSAWVLRHRSLVNSWLMDHSHWRL